MKYYKVISKNGMCECIVPKSELISYTHPSVADEWIVVGEVGKSDYEREQDNLREEYAEYKAWESFEADKAMVNRFK